MLHTHNSNAQQQESLKEDHRLCSHHVTDEIRSFTDHYHKRKNGILQCIEIFNVGETHKEERFFDNLKYKCTS